MRGRARVCVCVCVCVYVLAQCLFCFVFVSMCLVLLLLEYNHVFVSTAGLPLCRAPSGCLITLPFMGARGQAVWQYNGVTNTKAVVSV